MKNAIILLGILLLFSCNENNVELNGTWQLLSSKTIKADETIVDELPGQKMLKIINDTHFTFLRHDLDSNLVFVAGGGTYSFDGVNYHENLDFCNYREWEGHSFDFTISISNDTLIQTGLEEIEELGVKQTIIETYVKVK